MAFNISKLMASLGDNDFRPSLIPFEKHGSTNLTSRSQSITWARRTYGFFLSQMSSNNGNKNALWTAFT